MNFKKRMKNLFVQGTIKVPQPKMACLMYRWIQRKKKKKILLQRGVFCNMDKLIYNLNGIIKINIVVAQDARIGYIGNW